jgi:hypothetical protein
VRPALKRMMPSPPNAVPTPPPPEPQARSAAPGPALVQHARSATWLNRAEFFLRVMVRLYIGLILVFLPWTHFWTYNRFFLYYGTLAHITQNGALRGIVSGLGLLNLWIAITEAIHYREG